MPLLSYCASVSSQSKKPLYNSKFMDNVAYINFFLAIRTNSLIFYDLLKICLKGAKAKQDWLMTHLSVLCVHFIFNHIFFPTWCHWETIYFFIWYFNCILQPRGGFGYRHCVSQNVFEYFLLFFDGGTWYLLPYLAGDLQESSGRYSECQVYHRTIKGVSVSKRQLDMLKMALLPPWSAHSPKLNV